MKEKKNVETQQKGMNSLLRWPGGKRLLAKELVKMFPEHTCYVETFAGAAWVLFKKSPSEVEVLNDIHSDLINFYRVVKEKPYQLLLELQWELCSRSAFLEYRAQLENVEGLTDIQRAKMFFYTLKLSFSGQQKSYGYAKTRRPDLNLVDIETIILNAYERLRRVNIECLDYLDVIARYDSEESFFFADPPYRCQTSRSVYIKSFNDSDYIEFEKRLKSIKGKFILTLNDDEFIRDLFKDYIIEEIETTYSMCKDKVKKAQELVIKNF